MRPNDYDRTETQNFERKWCFPLDLPWFKLCLRAVWSLWLHNITLELVVFYASGVGVGGGGSLLHYRYFQPAENTKLQKEALSATVKRRKVAWFGHVTRLEEDLCWIICHAYLPDKPIGQGTELNWTKLIHEANNLEHSKWRQMWYQSKDNK